MTIEKVRYELSLFMEPENNDDNRPGSQAIDETLQRELTKYKISYSLMRYQRSSTRNRA